MLKTIKLFKDNKMRAPGKAMDKIVYNLNSTNGKPPFLIVSSAHQINGPYVMPTSWYNYFFKDRMKEQPYLYDGRFDNLHEIKTVSKETPDVVAVINRDPEELNRRVAFTRESLPLELSSDTSILPYDPANGMELEAILNMALRQENKKSIVYVSAHDATDITPEPDVPVNERDIVKGMYLYKAPKYNRSNARILASGRSLSVALRISDWIEERFSVYLEVWSCPSYTKISREMNDRYNEELTNSRGGLKPTHIQECMKAKIPTIALTYYNSLVCEQISKYFRTGFMPLGKVGREGHNMAGNNEVAARCVHHLAKHGACQHSWHMK